jgi:chemotaxis protein MotB
MADNQIIIINKKGKGHGGHHGGAWKVAYADFVTAMMAFFIVMWILAQSQEVKQQVSSYFKDPVGFTTKKGKYILDGGGGSQKAIMLKPELAASGGKGKEEGVAQQRQKLEEVSQEIMQEISAAPELKELLDKISITFDEQGMRIEIIKTDDVFFDIGGATLKKAARDLLTIIGKNLAKLNNRVVVEGHTDARPYPGKGFGYSNFELSSDRANSARRALMLGGVNIKQFDEVRGFADTKLRNPKDPYDSQNRRITILVKYQ